MNGSSFESIEVSNGSDADGVKFLLDCVEPGNFGRAVCIGGV
jgi:hypothetical protein